MDKIDWKLIEQLRLDGRKTFKELGEVIGFTSLGAGLGVHVYVG